ncbi:MAG: alpha/beta fold hydrolase [Verrucomicrobia bacterium]|nr:alpha/beta fold hydrolase [Cytophagales bacterium]
MKKIFRFLYGLAGIYFFIGFGFYFFQEKLLFQPTQLKQEFVFPFSEEYTERYFQTSTQATIHALHFKVAAAKGLIFYLHGNADDLLRWGQYAVDFTKHNYDVVMIDYRTFGKSTGAISQQADLEQDVNFIYRQLCKEYPESEIILYGRSLGTGLATFLASENKPKLLILETPYYEMKEVMNHFFPALPYDILLRYPLKSHIYIRRVSCPVYIFHGTADETVPYGSGKKLAEAYLKEKNLAGTDFFFTIPEGKHKNLRDFKFYHNKLAEILR